MALKPAHLVRPEGRYTDKDGTLTEGEGKILAETVNTLVERTGGPSFQAVRLPAYTVATLPPAVAGGAMIFVTNEAGGSVPAFDDGAGNWRRVTDRAIVS